MMNLLNLKQGNIPRNRMIFIKAVLLHNGLYFSMEHVEYLSDFERRNIEIGQLLQKWRKYETDHCKIMSDAILECINTAMNTSKLRTRIIQDRSKDVIQQCHHSFIDILGSDHRNKHDKLDECQLPSILLWTMKEYRIRSLMTMSCGNDLRL